MALGICPAVPLERAREKTREARKLVSDGIDPIEKAKRDDAAKAVAANNTFEKVVNDYINHLRALGRAEPTIKKDTWLLCSCL
jgi:hypothetical protein